MNRRIFSLIIYRLVFVSLLLLYQLLSLILDFPIMPFTGVFFICGGLSILSLWYLWWLRRLPEQSEKTTNFIVVQFALDIFCIGLLVIITGGVNSDFRFAYLLVILLSALFLEKIVIYAITVLSLSSYYVALNFASMLETPTWDYSDFFGSSPVLGNAMLAQFVLCFVTALVSAFIQTVYLSARKDLLEKEKNIRSLRIIRQKIVEGISSGLMMCGQDGEIIFINRMGKQLLQQDEGGLIGRDAREVLGLKLEREEDVDLDTTKTLRLRRVQSKVRVGDVDRTFGISTTPMKMESGQHGFLLVFQDLTQIRLLEEQQKLAERMSSIGKMAAGVAHEIRNPLAAISGSMQVLKELIPPKDETAEELASIVDKETKRLNDIISQFLAYARPGPPPSLLPIDLGKLTESFLALARNDAQLRKLAIEFEGDASNLVILGDEAKLTQVLWNLLRNAFTACSENGKVRMACRHEDQDVVLQIIDNGVGMSEEQLQDLFTPFSSFTGRGIGLGMSIVYDIIQSHAGEINVTSKEGNGTTVTLTFPRYQE